LHFLGFTLAQIRDGFNDKGGRSATGMPRMRPHHRDTLYNLLKAIKIESLGAFQEAHTDGLIDHDLLTSGIFLIDGTGLRGSDRHVVIMQQGGSAPPFIVNWRVQGPGKELEAGRAMVQELQQKMGAEAIRWLLMDGAYVDGAWLAHLQQQGIGAMVRVYEEMQIFQEMRLLSRLPEHEFEPYRYVRTIQGHKEQHEVELAFFWNLGMWASYEQVWKKRVGPGGEIPGLWGVLIREERRETSAPHLRSKVVDIHRVVGLDHPQAVGGRLRRTDLLLPDAYHAVIAPPFSLREKEHGLDTFRTPTQGRGFAGTDYGAIGRELDDRL
jgi:hypothetical protein